MKRNLRVILVGLCILLPMLVRSQNQYPDLLDNPTYDGTFNRDNHLPSGTSTQYTWVSSGEAYNPSQNHYSLSLSGRLTVGSQASSYNQYGAFFNRIGHNATQNSPNEQKRFLIVNGYGGNISQNNYTQYQMGTVQGVPSPKIIIKYVNVQVEPYVYYDLKFYATHLSSGSNALFPNVSFRAIFRIQGNGTNILTYPGNQTNWEPAFVQNDPDPWKQSPTFRVNSGNNTQLTIAFFDDCIFDAGLGDDFGIDDVSLRMASEYSVTANSFTAPSVCLSCEYEGINLGQGNHVVINAPQNQPTTSTIVQISKDGSGWGSPTSPSTAIPTTKGTAYLDPDNNMIIHYVPGSNASPGNTDQIRYRIKKFGLTSSPAIITINIKDVPTVNSTSGIPSDGYLCRQDIGTFSPSATWNANGSAVNFSGWEWSTNPNAITWSMSNSFNSNLPVGDYYIRFYASNECTDCDQVAVSDPIQLHVCDVPVLTTTSISTPPTLCGQYASLPASYLQQVDVATWNNNDGTKGWQVSHNNGITWLPLGETTLSDNDRLRYHAQNDCNEANSFQVTVTITDGPYFSQSTPIFDAYYCSGQQLQLPLAPTFNNNGIAVSDQYWGYSNDGGNTFIRIYGNPILTEAWDGRLICYILEFDCGGVPSKAYSSPQRQLTVYGTPEFLDDLPEIGHSFCVGDYLTVSDLQAPACSGSPELGTYWEISANPTTNFTPFSLPRLLSNADNNKWIRLHAVDCGETHTNSVQLQVNAVPVISIPAVPNAICAGNSFELTVPNIQNSGVLSDWGWQYSSTQNGTFTSFDNNEVSYGFNGYWIRYFAQNECGTGSSQPVQITVNDLPVVGSINTPSAICAGESFELTEPSVDCHHETPCVGTWEIADPQVGEFQPLINNNIPYEYDGYQLRYRAENGCGITYSTNLVTVTVYSTDPVYEDTIVACDVMEHHGVMCTTPGDYNAIVQSADGCDIIAYWHFELSDAYEAPTVRDTTCDSYYWPRTNRDYYVSGNYDTTIVSTDPLICDSIFTLAVVINHAPEIISSIQQSQVQPICEHQNLNFPNPTVSWNIVGSQNYGGFWEASSTINGTYVFFSLEDVSYDYDQWYVRYHAMNDCGDDWSDPVQITVRRAPVVVTQVPEMDGVCAGNALPLPPMTVEWYGPTGTEGWYLSSPLGNAIPIDENTPMQFNYNGWTLFYQATNSCGDIVSNERTISVNNIPSVSEIPPVAGICAGGSFDLPEMNPEWNGSTGQGTWQIAETPAGPFTNLVNQNILYSYNNWWLRYKATNVCGSDTSRMVQVQVYPSDDLEETLQACHPLNIYGFNCDHDDDYTKDSITEYGCEVTFTLHFSLGEQFVYPTEMVEECDAYYWEKFHKWFYESTNPTFDTLISGGSANACDTLYSIHVDITHPNPMSVTPVQHCTSYFWDVNGITYTESTIDTFYRANGPCTDTLVLRLTIAPLEDESSVVMCQDYFWPEAGLWIEVGGAADTVMFDAETGCDVHYVVHVVEGSDIGGTSEPVSTCEPYYWHGNYYQESGVYTYNNEDPLTGCHVVDTLKLEVNGFSDFDISGSTQVAVATSFWPGVYHYTVDVETEDPIHWQLLDADWAYDTLATGKTCWVEVTSTGSARLIARLGDGGCNSDTIYINATQFAVDEQEPLPLNIYPNPAKHQVTIESENIRQVKVYDMLGQLVRAYSCQGDPRLTVDVSEFAASFYVVEVQTDRGIARKALSVYR